MDVSRFAILLVCVLGLLARGETVAQANARVIRLTSLDWPPYTGQALPHGGATTTTVRAALAAEGVGLEVEFFPWSRAVALIKRPSRFTGYFPEYMSEEIGQNCWLSDPIGSGVVGFAQLGERPIQWTTMDDLTPQRIGVVQDYVNSPELDLRIAQNKLVVDIARDDAHNLRKLLAGRVALAVVDQRVFDYLMHHDPQLRQHRDKLVLNERPLETKELFICFRRDPEGERARDLVNAGLRKIGVDTRAR
jgi:polar amino acid transport system substrate-binding protein